MITINDAFDIHKNYKVSGLQTGADCEFHNPWLCFVVGAEVLCLHN